MHPLESLQQPDVRNGFLALAEDWATYIEKFLNHRGIQLQVSDLIKMSQATVNRLPLAWFASGKTIFARDYTVQNL